MTPDPDELAALRARVAELEAVSATAFRRGWIAGRDAAAAAIDGTATNLGRTDQIWFLGHINDAIRALTPPEGE